MAEEGKYDRDTLLNIREVLGPKPDIPEALFIRLQELGIRNKKKRGKRGGRAARQKELMRILAQYLRLQDQGVDIHEAMRRPSLQDAASRIDHSETHGDHQKRRHSCGESVRQTQRRQSYPNTQTKRDQLPIQGTKRHQSYSGSQTEERRLSLPQNSLPRRHSYQGHYYEKPENEQFVSWRPSQEKKTYDRRNSVLKMNKEIGGTLENGYDQMSGGISNKYTAENVENAKHTSPRFPIPVVSGRMDKNYRIPKNQEHSYKNPLEVQSDWYSEMKRSNNVRDNPDYKPQQNWKGDSHGFNDCHDLFGKYPELFGNYPELCGRRPEHLFTDSTGLHQRVDSFGKCHNFLGEYPNQNRKSNVSFDKYQNLFEPNNAACNTTAPVLPVGEKPQESYTTYAPHDYMFQNIYGDYATYYDNANNNATQLSSKFDKNLNMFNSRDVNNNISNNSNNHGDQYLNQNIHFNNASEISKGAAGGMMNKSRRRPSTQIQRNVVEILCDKYKENLEKESSTGNDVKNIPVRISGSRHDAVSGLGYIMESVDKIPLVNTNHSMSMDEITRALDVLEKAFGAKK